MLSYQDCCVHLGDIADPRHPFRFHNVVSSLRRSVTPVEPQPSPSSPPHESPDSLASHHVQDAPQTSSVLPQADHSSKDQGTQHPVSNSASQSSADQHALHAVQSSSKDCAQHDTHSSNEALESTESACTDESSKEANRSDDNSKGTEGIQESASLQETQTPQVTPSSETPESLEGTRRQISHLQKALKGIQEEVASRAASRAAGRAAGSAAGLAAGRAAGKVGSSSSRGSSIGQAPEDGNATLLSMLSGPMQNQTISRGGPVPGGQVRQY